MAHQNHEYHEYIVEQTEKVIGIDSPTGYHYNVQKYLVDTIQAMGFEVRTLRKGGVIANLGGEGNPLMMLAHVDTLGAFVHYIKGNGRLAISNGTLNPNNIETENVRVITRSGAVYEGTIQLENASVHVNPDVNAERKFTNLEVVLDEDVTSKEDVEKLGICAGDFLAVEPRFQVTEKGYIKSRFLDDKLSAAILLAYGRYLKEEKVVPERHVYAHFTIYEEVGHGGSASVPEGVTEAWSVDMGCVGDGLTCTEHEVSICAKDSGGPYNYEVVCRLVELAKEHEIGYAVDVYPHYGSDVETTLRSGHDIRHALIGPGVYASHGYERSHKDGVCNTFRLIQAYLG